MILLFTFPFFFSPLPRYTHLLHEAMVMASRSMVWCPTPDCKTVVKAESAVATLGSVECKTCKNQFCFECGVRSTTLPPSFQQEGRSISHEGSHSSLSNICMLTVVRYPTIYVDYLRVAFFL